MCWNVYVSGFFHRNWCSMISMCCICSSIRLSMDNIYWLNKGTCEEFIRKMFQFNKLFLIGSLQCYVVIVANKQTTTTQKQTKIENHFHFSISRIFWNSGAHLRFFLKQTSLFVFLAFLMSNEISISSIKIQLDCVFYVFTYFS